MSEAEWNKLVDEHVAELNKRKDAIIIPPPTHMLIESEYQQSQNHQFVTEDLIRHFAYAVGDPNPLWRDPAYARSTRWGGIIAPPFLIVVLRLLMVPVMRLEALSCYRASTCLLAATDTSILG